MDDRPHPDDLLADNPLLAYFIRNGDEGIFKWLDYFDVYHRCFARYRGRPIKFLEIGMQNGGSARMWRNYFGPQATIIGVDVDPACKALEGDGLEVWIGDQADPAFWKDFVSVHPALDIVLDDGGHTMQQQIVTFETLFPHLKNFGTYLCEDTHTSYFSGFGGGLEEPYTFHAYMKSLVDAMHASYHAPLASMPSQYWAHNLYSLSFFDSIVVAEKRFRNIPLTFGRGSHGHAGIQGATDFLQMRRAHGVPD